MDQAKQKGKHALITGGLELSHLLSRLKSLQSLRGRGAIFTLHHVRPQGQESFAPNAHLEVEPGFLDALLTRLAAEGYRFAALDDVPALLGQPKGEPPFAVFTLDDGYRNNLDHALPVFRRHAAPFTVFVAQGLSQRRTSLWWETLGRLIAQQEQLSFDFGSGEEPVSLKTPAEKQRGFARFSRYIAAGDEAGAVARLDALARRHGLDPLALVEALVMDAGDLKRLAGDPLASLGAHTVSHRALARLSPKEALMEMRQSGLYVGELTGKLPRSLAFPYGFAAAAGQREARLAEEAGFALALTTRPSCLFGEGRERLTFLPRISLNGLYQKPRYVSALASGIPMRLMRG